MDPIWLCATTLLLHVFINRVFGRVCGWLRLVQWPWMQAMAMGAHAVVSSAPVCWVLDWSGEVTGVTEGKADLCASAIAAAVAAFVLRRKWRASYTNH